MLSATQPSYPAFIETSIQPPAGLVGEGHILFCLILTMGQVWDWAHCDCQPLLHSAAKTPKEPKGNWPEIQQVVLVKLMMSRGLKGGLLQ